MDKINRPCENMKLLIDGHYHCSKDCVYRVTDNYFKFYCILFNNTPCELIDEVIQKKEEETIKDRAKPKNVRIRL